MVKHVLACLIKGHFFSEQHFDIINRVATVRENVWKMKFFPGQEKVREFFGWSGKFRKDLESQKKVREFENKWLWQSSENLFILLKKGKGCTFS